MITERIAYAWELYSREHPNCANRIKMPQQDFDELKSWAKEHCRYELGKEPDKLAYNPDECREIMGMKIEICEGKFEAYHAE